jgi:phosphatidylglycerol:prolipoprotein diacylglycerol transferase
MRRRGYHGAVVHPILFRVGSYEVPSYGAALALAFAVGIEVARRRARGVGLDGERIVDASLVILVASIVGARVLWLATHAETFRGGWLEAIDPFARRPGAAGLSMLGGVALAAASAVAWLAWRGMPVLRSCDLLAPSVALGEGITRVGCFLNGCCFGLPCDHAFCLRFPAASGAGEVFPGQALHPTQLYASALGFAGFALLSALWRRRPAEGSVFLALLIYLGLGRLGLDLLRYQEPSTLLLRRGALAFSASDALAAAALGLGAVGLAVLSARPGRSA